MKIVNKLSLLSLVIVATTPVGWIILPGIATDGEAAYSKGMNEERQGQRDLPKDPCWFVTLNDKSIPYEVISKREDREMRGYPGDVPLTEAIRIFNEEKQCLSVFAPYPPLTEDELIASIVAGPHNGLTGDALKFQKDMLWKIATQKVMPKGTLLVAITGSRVQESPLRPNGTIRAEGISIVLHLGLENHEYGQLLRPEQTFVIRRTYFKVETIR